MKGTIRMALGFVLAFGAVGGMEQTPGYLPEQIALACAGLALMAWAVKDIKRA